MKMPSRLCRFTWQSNLLLVDPNGELIVYDLYAQKATAIDALWNLVGEQIRDAASMGAEVTLDASVCEKFTEIMENA